MHFCCRRGVNSACCRALKAINAPPLQPQPLKPTIYGRSALPPPRSSEGRPHNTRCNTQKNHDLAICPCHTARFRSSSFENAGKPDTAARHYINAKWRKCINREGVKPDHTPRTLETQGQLKKRTQLATPHEAPTDAFGGYKRRAKREASDGRKQTDMSAEDTWACTQLNHASKSRTTRNDARDSTNASVRSTHKNNTKADAAEMNPGNTRATIQDDRGTPAYKEMAPSQLCTEMEGKRGARASHTHQNDGTAIGG
ncbi:hypothetical protein TRVL_04360 [Trypanosoma vivax]|nr:hypothetical protein TRVL_04360 [Trypanosoma vivax]